MTDTPITIRCFHGSPGVPEDFAPLARELPELALTSRSRAGYPTAADFGDVARKPAWILGYSWGCAEALAYAASNPSIELQGLLLVSPYLFPGPGLSVLKRTLIQVPFLGDALLKKAGAAAIESLLIKSSAPAQPTPEYRRTSEHYRNPQALRQAALEKCHQGPRIQELLQTVRSSRKAVFLIHGTEDETSSEVAQFSPIRKALLSGHERRLENAGHALIYTHPRQLAEIIRGCLGFFEPPPGGRS